jgi:5-hydroxyisourate hydrolase-like protein (transthyretin family)
MAQSPNRITNITEQHTQNFQALTSGNYENFALFSCFVNGSPAAAIVVVKQVEDDRNVELIPVFVSVTHDMVLTDHDGRSVTSPAAAGDGESQAATTKQDMVHILSSYIRDEDVQLSRQEFLTRVAIRLGAELGQVKHQEAEDILRLAGYVKSADQIQFHSGDREPGSDLDDRGRKWIAEGLELLANTNGQERLLTAIEEAADMLEHIIPLHIYDDDEPPDAPERKMVEQLRSLLGPIRS